MKSPHRTTLVVSGLFVTTLFSTYLATSETNELLAVFWSNNYNEMHYYPASAPTFSSLDKKEHTHKNEPPLPSCQDLMNTYDPYKDGAFLTRPTTEVVWRMRSDESRELTLPHTCRLKRYEAEEARQCLAGRHIAMIGDSLTRYQYLSLLHFIERRTYPPRFGETSRKGSNCTHIDEETGLEQCSKPGEPNICMEGDWNKYGGWPRLHQAIGGGEDGDLFHGRAQCNCARVARTDENYHTESIHYVSEEIDVPSEEGGGNNSNKKRIKMSEFTEIGWHMQAAPLNGFTFSNCSYDGTCRHTSSNQTNYRKRVDNKEWDWSAPLKEALNSTLKEAFPDVDIVIYNRGLWNQITTAMAGELLPLFQAWAGGNEGRCFYRSTTGSGRTQPWLKPGVERDRMFQPTVQSGCGYLDFAHVTREFDNFVMPPRSLFAEAGKYSYADEFDTIFWDQVHYIPWVYEELNNLLLNVLCNVK